MGVGSTSIREFGFRRRTAGAGLLAQLLAQQLSQKPGASISRGLQKLKRDGSSLPVTG